MSMWTRFAENLRDLSFREDKNGRRETAYTKNSPFSETERKVRMMWPGKKTCFLFFRFLSSRVVIWYSEGDSLETRG